MRKGFTLVELSIVLVIIGLLIGGILVAQSMIETAKTHTYIKELNAFKFSYDNFKETFKQMPGDFNRRIETFGGTVNGNGDGLVQWATQEPTYFWLDLESFNFKDLRKTFRVQGEYIIREKKNSTNDNQFYYPFTYHNQGPGRYGDLYNSYNDSNIGSETTITLTSKESAAATVNKAALKASQLMAIDNKVDDSMPLTGKIRGHRGENSSLATTCSHDVSGTFQYKVDESAPNCRMLYLIERY